MTTTDTRDTFNNLRDLTLARDSLAIDWGRFSALFRGAAGSEDFEARAVAAIIGASTRPGMTCEQARAALDLCAAQADAEADAACIPDDDLCVLLRELVAADDLPGLEVALFKLEPHDGRAYAKRLLALADADEPNKPRDADAVRDEKARAMIDCPKPGRVIGLELAGAVVDAIEHWHHLKTETPHQAAVRQAFKEARRLMDLHGDGDPRALSAAIKAIELQDPGCRDRKLAECGIHLPAPTHCNAEGEGLLTLEQVADALGADPDELLDHARDLEALGLGVLHHAGQTFHALQ